MLVANLISKLPVVDEVAVAVMEHLTHPLPSLVQVAVHPVGVPATPVVKLKKQVGFPENAAEGRTSSMNERVPNLAYTDNV